MYQCIAQNTSHCTHGHKVEALPQRAYSLRPRSCNKIGLSSRVSHHEKVKEDGHCVEKNVCVGVGEGAAGEGRRITVWKNISKYT